VQLDRKMALIDASLKRRRVPHFREVLSTKAEKRTYSSRLAGPQLDKHWNLIGLTKPRFSNVTVGSSVTCPNSNLEPNSPTRPRRRRTLNAKR
jgi:hypothetical protein